MKKLVHYDPSKGVHNIVVGKSAIVTPIDHPDAELVSNHHPVLTTPVEFIVRKAGSKEITAFETKNTRYIPRTLADD